MAKTGYAEIAAHYRRLIDEGTLKAGDPMPPMSQVQKDFGVTITTANRAYRLLKTEGLTEAKPGVGTVVAERSRVASTGAARLQRLERTGKPYAPGETATDHQAALRSCADPEIAELLGVELHDEIVLRSRVFLREGQPAVVALSCIHPRALGPVPELLGGPLDRFWQELYTERTGRVITRSPERRGARLASNSELGALSVAAPAGAAVPVLVLRNVFHDEDGPIEVWEDVYAPGLWQVASGPGTA
ncbi:GntR family transcriptional regulator [Streptomyces sp. NBC_00378]|uniref:GntR family transcriptional regulator n=1 Tax=unclassified Streptomyces TaxID=2593676 RepID=UPI002250E0E9|nr:MULTISPECIES: GntR family transcriptional regulator [unclassified Streptomyces]MCX5114387.1 GntR family transcriptional regulator [Streptomyces sp. NBC_00378]